jgi:ABC-type nitrate/sulfonate/bicarbonate transport system permease component
MRADKSARRLERIALWISIPLFLLVWQAASTSGYVNELLFPPPTRVAVALWDELVKGTLILDLSMSVMRVVIGFASGAAAGIMIGLVTGRYPVISNLLTPIFQLLRPIPPIAFVPIVILWFGLSEWGKWFLVFWGVFFTVWIATHLGVQRADPALIRAARSLGTPDRMLVRDVILPSALPTIFVGLRTAVSISFYTLVAAELAGAFAGLAYRIDLAHQNMQTGQMLGGPRHARYRVGCCRSRLFDAVAPPGVVELTLAGRAIERRSRDDSPASAGMSRTYRD